MMRTMYHTQEHRKVFLTKPVICNRNDAWLGSAYYFWYDLKDALKWGIDSKKQTMAFEIYSAEIDMENVLDTVFNENHYRFWLKQILRAAHAIRKKTGLKPTVVEINEYFKERANWNDICTGILFQDVPQNDRLLKVSKFYYRKRIQLAAYNLEIIHNFALRRVIKLK